MWHAERGSRSTGGGLAGHRRHRSGIPGHLAIRGHRGGDVGIYFYWNGSRLGTPHIVPESSSKHHLRGGSRRKTPSRTREASLGRRRQYSATMPRKGAGLHSPYLPKHAPCTCEMGDASDEMIQKRRTMCMCMAKHSDANLTKVCMRKHPQSSRPPPISTQNHY